MKDMKAFILAAGLGERLRPITDHLPKPLIPILGKPVIESVVERISALPVKHIGINLHYKAAMIRDWAKASEHGGGVEFFFEEKILGTGGAIKNAERFLQGSFFIVHNSDILSDISLEALIERHFSEGNVATLAVHNYQKFNHVWIDERGGLQFVGKTDAGEKGLRKVAFTGIAVYSPEFLPLLPPGNSSIVDAWLKASSSGLKVGTADFTGCRWEDIGSPEAYSSYVFNALKEEGEVVFAPSSVDCSGARLVADTVIEKGSIIDEGVSLRNCILLPGARAKKGSHIENAIIGPDYRIDLKEPPAAPSRLPADIIAKVSGDCSGELTTVLIGTGGSDRKYYRVRCGGKEAVLMECPKTDPDYQRHVIYTHFFRRHSVPVPELLWSDESDSEAVSLQLRSFYGLFEDLGDVSLYSWLKCKKDPALLESMYRRVMDVLINLHTSVSASAAECRLLHSRTFDYGHLRWEADYFVERFLTGVRGLRIADAASLSGEFDRLARRVDSFWKTIVHRDFQSQNIMVMQGDIPRLIDYQGARMGPPAYDLVSILWDPYFLLDANLRVLLLEYYIAGLRSFYGRAFDEITFRETVLPCRLQRHMQALGAYGFLSKVKGRAYFLKYVPQAIRYLKEDVEEAKDEYPALWECVKDLLDEKAEN